MVARHLPDEGDLDSFLAEVDDVSRLIDGLKEGTISPEYIDTKQSIKLKAKEAKEAKEAQRAKLKPAASAHVAPSTASTDSATEEAARKQRVLHKIEELRASRWKKLKARERYDDYVRSRSAEGTLKEHGVSTDYGKWDLYCPDDEEDDLFNSLTPNAPEFRAMEKDIDVRHKRMIEQRQLAERQRVAGNAAFKSGQFSEALRCYEIGIENQKTSMTLHGNAAMAALKLKCFVQAIEHCDKVLNIADFLHNNLKDPLCVKAYQRRATAYRALQHFEQALKDMEAAAATQPDDAEVQQQLAKAKLEVEEHRKAKAIKKMLAKGADDLASAGVAAADRWDLDKLHRVERLTSALQARGEGGLTTSGEEAATGRRGLPQLPPQKPKHTAAAPAAATGPACIPGVGTAAGTPAAQGKLAPSNGNKTPQQASLASVCLQLQGLLLDDDTCCVYFRECGGLKAAADQLASPGVLAASATAPAPPAAPAGTATNATAAGGAAERGAVAQLLLLLNTSCSNDANLELLPGTGVLSIAVQLLGSPETGIASAAATLLCTAATKEAVRKAISKLIATMGGLSSAIHLLQHGKPAVQGIVLTLLGNCTVDKVVKDAMHLACTKPAPSANPACTAADAVPASTAACPELLAVLEALLVPMCAPHIVERVLTLLGNMSGGAALRGPLLSRRGLLSSALALFLAAPAAASTSSTSSTTCNSPDAAAGTTMATCTATPPEVAIAAGTLLYNLSVDAEGQALMLQDKKVAGLLQMLVHADARLASRAAGVLSRLAKQPEGVALLLGGSAVKLLVQHCLLPRATAVALDNDTETIAPVPLQAANIDSAKTAAIAAALLQDAAVRVLAQLTGGTDPEAEVALEQLVAADGTAVLLQLLSSSSSEAVLGNASLVVGHISRLPARLPHLRELDAVAPLIKVAYDGKGNTASKNAAIALARLAGDAAMMERLRELHGLEIIYQYVRP